MARYRGSRVKVIRRLGPLPGFTTKENLRNSLDNSKQISQYGFHLQEKQKLRYHYGVSEHELIKYVKQSRKKKGNTGDVLLELLEMRLDNIIFKAGLVSTISAARQLVSHGHVLINGKKVTIPSFSCSLFDKILVCKSVVNSLFFDDIRINKFSHISCENISNGINITIKNKPNIDILGFSINILLVLEYYSGK